MTSSQNKPGTIFHLTGISKCFGDTEENKVWALKDVSIDIHKGEFCALVGPSGSGKSTLLNIMSGLEKPTKGDVCLLGQSLRHLKEDDLAILRRDHIGLIFQAYNLIPVLTAQENIEYVMMLQGISEKERDERVGEILSVVGLSGKEKRFPSQLSGGQQQRVAIARAMVSRPNIIMADEPTANLDSKTGGELLDMMKRLNEKYQMTFVFSTHDPMIMKRAKRLVTLRDGQICEDQKVLS